MSQQPLVNIRDFRVCFLDHGKELPAVDGVNLDIYPGEIIGIVGNLVPSEYETIIVGGRAACAVP